MSGFKDTVSFRINPCAPAKTLHDIASLKGVFALRAAASEANTFHVELETDADAGTVLEQIRWRDGIVSAKFVPLPSQCAPSLSGLPLVTVMGRCIFPDTLFSFLVCITNQVSFYVAQRQQRALLQCIMRKND